MAQIRDMGDVAEAVQLDLGDATAAATMATNAHQCFGRIHSVVYSAGPALHREFIGKLEPAEWANADVCGCFNFIHATLHHLKKAGGGAYVMVITSAVERVPARDICSAAPKAAIEMLMRGLAKEEGRSGIRANCVGPG